MSEAIVPVRIKCWTERGKVRHVWDYRAEDTGVPFWEDGGYYESSDQRRDHVDRGWRERERYAETQVERQKCDRNQPDQPDRSW